MEENESTLLKGKILSCLLENEIANTGSLADYCDLRGKSSTKYRDIKKPLTELVQEGWVVETGKYRPERSIYRYGTGYSLTRDFAVLHKIFQNSTVFHIQDTFLQSHWLRQLIIDNHILQGEEKSPDLLNTMLQISPAFFKYCLLNSITSTTLSLWETPTTNPHWLYTALSENSIVESINQDYQFLEIFRVCLLHDLAIYDSGEIKAKKIQTLINRIRNIQKMELRRMLNFVIAGRTAESINYFTGFVETKDAKTIEEFNYLVLSYMECQYDLPKLDGEELASTVAQTKDIAHEISEKLGLKLISGSKESSIDPIAFLEEYLKKERSAGN